jgi:ABC-type microcin C transport system duplicated ATPase subunit YejF
MSQQELREIRPWVIIAVFKENTNLNDLQRISPQIQNLVDEWQSQGKMMWSGAFDDDATSMTIFEGTEQEANEFYSKYDKICSGILQYSMYQWDAMPILSVLSK